jgi:hypothetical protein
MAIETTGADNVRDGTVCNASDQTAQQKVLAEVEEVFAEIEAGDIGEEQLDLDYLDHIVTSLEQKHDREQKLVERLRAALARAARVK